MTYRWRSLTGWVVVLPLAMAALLAACSSGGGDKQSGSLFGGQQDKGQAAATVQTTSSEATTAPTTSAAATVAPTVAARATTAPTAPAAAQGGGSPASFDPCSLVTKTEAAAALGEAVGDGESVGPISQSHSIAGLTLTIYHCGYQSPTTVHEVEFDVWRGPSGSAGQVRQSIDAVCRQFGKERLSGFGDVACWYDSSHKELSLVKGATYINVRVSPAANVDPAEVVKTITKKILERLP